MWLVDGGGGHGANNDGRGDATTMAGGGGGATPAWGRMKTRALVAEAEVVVGR